MCVGRRLLCKGVTERARGRERKGESNCANAREREKRSERVVFTSSIVSRDFDGY